MILLVVAVMSAWPDFCAAVLCRGIIKKNIGLDECWEVKMAGVMVGVNRLSTAPTWQRNITCGK